MSRERSPEYIACRPKANGPGDNIEIRKPPEYPIWVTLPRYNAERRGMPIEYQIYEKLGIVYRKFSGSITLAELGRHWRKLLSDPRVPETLALAADLRGCEITITGEEVRGLVRAVIAPHMEGRRWVSAIVVDEDGPQRALIDGFVEHSQELGVTEMFADPEAAVEWPLEAIGPPNGRGDQPNKV